MQGICLKMMNSIPKTRSLLTRYEASMGFYV